MGFHFLLQCMKVKSESEVIQSCLSLSDRRNCSLPSSSIHGIFQAKVLQWGAIAFSIYFTQVEGNFKRGIGTDLAWYLNLKWILGTSFLRKLGDSEYIFHHIIHRTPLQYSCLENPMDKEPGRLQSMGSLRVGHDWVTSFSLYTSCIGEGNDNPFQCSCLENPRDGGARWAAVKWFAHSWTRLKWLSSSSSRI